MLCYDTKAEVLERLEKMTRELRISNLACFTTAKIAFECHVSRSLASQYLNEFVRQDLAIKINSRPVIYLHRHAAERYFQMELDKDEYSSQQELLACVGLEELKDFDKAIGFELSYGTCIDHLKSAIRYPPHGIPVLLVGEHGTGKRLMSELAFEYGKNVGVLPKCARYVSIDCRSFEATDANVEAAIYGEDGKGGVAAEAAGGMVYLSGFDHLSRTTRETVLQRIGMSSNNEESDASPARFILSTARSEDSNMVKETARFVPIVIQLPRLVDRSVEERTSLVLHYLRVEGRRVGADVSVSRGALRALVETDFRDNIDGLKSCITNCCAGAYLNRNSEMLTIQTYNLPSNILRSTESEPDDNQLISGSKAVNDPSMRVIGLFQKIINPIDALETGKVSFVEFFSNASTAVQSYNDYINFESRSSNPRIGSYERLLSPVIEQTNRTYGIELTRKLSRSIAQSLFTQLWGGVNLTKWRQKNGDAIARTLRALTKNLPETATVADQIVAKTKSALGMDLDALARMILLIEVGYSLRATGGPQDYLGVIVCHGYSTATSIADACNRILHAHVFEAIDMAYDQDLTNVVGQLSCLLERHANCKAIAVLVDMGSLESVNDAISGLTTCDINIVNNVSTALALEVGSALLSGENLEEILTRSAEYCAPRYSVVKGAKVAEAVLFCSELGIEAAGKIRQIVQNSLPGKTATQLITCDYADLAQRGEASSVFDDYRVRAIVSTMNPGISSVPFVGLEDVLYQGSSDALDRALFPLVDPGSVAEFHSNLLRNLTLRNVIESLTILNPEMLYVEADRAVKRLSELSGKPIDARRRIGVYVHLCGLIERLMTKNFVDTAPDVERFEAEHADFIGWFREAFSDMTCRYRVEIPISEISYVHHMLHTQVASTSNRTTIAGMVLEDE
ncbi:MAG: PRD domain-containing protein [Coriobacteriaceae bacterium]|nr:PRD domain-containing protein [Coriobacteriaceae bacterium]